MVTGNFYYFPILKTRNAEMKAYENLSEQVKDEILPIFELTGAKGYTFGKNCKDPSKVGMRRPGDITKKRNEILRLVGERPFILDITDDESLLFDGLSPLTEPNNGFCKWVDFLISNEKFKSQVIPTIQFNTDENVINDTFKQIEILDKYFNNIAIKLPAFIFKDENINDSNLFDIKNIIANVYIQGIIDRICEKLTGKKLIVILDFGFIKKLENYNEIINLCIQSINNLSQIKALITTSSCFPSFVGSAISNAFQAYEKDIYELVKSSIKENNKIFCGDYASLHPVKYTTSGGGWIPRIDCTFYDKNTKSFVYFYHRGIAEDKNDSKKYIELAQRVVNSDEYQKILNYDNWGNEQIQNKAKGALEGKIPSHWISVRSNHYINQMLTYLKANISNPFSLFS